MRIYRTPIFLQKMFPSVIFARPARKNQIYLTFDDGPHENFTPQILDILGRHQIKATFFILGKKIKGKEALIRRLDAEGHTAGIHGYDHVSLLFSSKEQIKQQILRAKDAIEFVLGKEVSLFRPPYGRFNLKMINLCQSLQLKLVLWSLMVYDFDLRISNERLLEIFHSKARSGDIVLLHDGHVNSFRTINVLHEIAGAKFFQRHAQNYKPFSALSDQH